MAKREKRNWKEELELEERSADPSLEQQEEVSRNPADETEVVRVDPERERGEPETHQEIRLDLDIIDADTNADEVMEDIDDYTADEAILEDFRERQQLTEGSDDLYEKLRQHHSNGPGLSGDDLDAAWEDSDVSGEESVGASAPTPDQDVVDELGEALGINYMDAEPLHTDEKLAARDERRWELNPASAEELENQEEEIEELEIEDLQDLLDEEIALEEETENGELDEDEEFADGDNLFDLDGDDWGDDLDEYLEDLDEDEN
jgi:hypothetical protein